MGVRLRYLDTAMTVIGEAHGSVDAYLEEKLGVDGAMQETIRARLLES